MVDRGAKSHAEREPAPGMRTELQPPTQRVDTLSKPGQAISRIASRGPTTVVFDFKRGRAVCCGKCDTAVTRAAVLDHVRNRLTDRPGDRRFVCGVNRRGSVVDGELDTRRSECGICCRELGVDGWRMFASNCGAHIAYRLTCEALH